MSVNRIYKLQSPVSAGGVSLSELTVRRIVPADRPVIASAIRAERRKTIRPISASRIAAVMAATMCDVPFDVAKRISPADLRAISKIVGDGLAGRFR